MSDDCLFCKIAAGKIPSHCVYQDARTYAFLDINPMNDGHTLVIPRRHYELTHEMEPEDAAAVMQTVVRVAGAISRTTGKHYNVLSNNGAQAGQIVKHVHYHIIPKDETHGLVCHEQPMEGKAPLEQTLTSIVKEL